MLSGSEKPLVHGGCEAFAVLICWPRHSKGKYGRCPIIRFMRYIIYVSINHNLILTQFSILVAYFGEPNKKKVALVKKWTPKIQRCFHPTIDPSPLGSRKLGISPRCSLCQLDWAWDPWTYTTDQILARWTAC